MTSFVAEVVCTDDVDGVASLQDQAQVLLREYSLQRHAHSSPRFGRLLLALARIHTVTSDALTAIFFRDTVGNVPIDRLILDIFKTEMRKMDQAMELAPNFRF